MAQQVDGETVHITTKRSGQMVFHSDPNCVRVQDTNTRPVPKESLYDDAKACDYCHDTDEQGADP